MSDFELLKYYNTISSFLSKFLKNAKKTNGAAQPRQDFNV